MGSWSVRPLVVIISAVVIFGLILPRAGLLVALPILIVMSARASEEFRSRDALISAGVITFISWLLFVQTLHLEIPLLPVFSF